MKADLPAVSVPPESSKEHALTQARLSEGNSGQQVRGFEVVIGGPQASRTTWADLWHSRELLFFLAWRDLLVRYKQTLVGVAWSVIRPLATMAIFTFVFSRVAQLPSEGTAPYAVLVYAAMLPWTFFAGAFADSANSLANNASILTKVYFPRLLIPASTVLVNLVDFLISLGVLLALMGALHAPFSWRLVLLPLILLPALVGALGLGLILGALNVKYRDVRHLIPFLTQFGLYLSPVGFSSSVIPEQWRLLYSLNPVVGVIDGFRWAIVGGPTAFNWESFLISVAAVSCTLALGLRVFRRTEQQFADVI
ncbi:ABC transporter permease [Deinococcus oregonensis]|uniref:Transport permease protein n=1 Tax=Deinococcus oregonensis TaxID=1805970 RepID=A0ABV6AUY6_9DEIO